MLSTVLLSGGDTTSTVKTVTDALESSMQTAGSDMLGVIASIVPVVIPVLIGLSVIGIGIRVFKKVTGR